jgi:hypothetical protein
MANPWQKTRDHNAETGAGEFIGSFFRLAPDRESALALVPQYSASLGRGRAGMFRPITQPKWVVEPYFLPVGISIKPY